MVECIAPCNEFPDNTSCPDRKAQIKRQNELAKIRRSKMPLTNIELEIIQHIYEEKTSQEISDIMGRSRRTMTIIVFSSSRKLVVRTLLESLSTRLRRN